MELKHVGRVKSTNRKCLVAYRTLPGDAYNCLIITTENLPDSWHDALINLVESPAGQSSYEFAEALDRTTFPDGSRMLPALHANGRLIKVGTSEIEMTPTTSVAIVLSELNQLIAEQRGMSVDSLSLQDPKSVKTDVKEEPAKTTAEAVIETPTATVTTSVPQSFASVEDEAKFYRSQADKLAKEAAAFRRKAEELAPIKRPAAK